jgi:hypothetical protein
MLTLTVSQAGFENWDAWVYPEINTVETDELKIVDNLDIETFNYLKEGGKVLLSLRKGEVNNRSILVSGGDLVNDLQNRPEARQLMASLKKYMSGDQFNPSSKLNSEEIKSIVSLW